MPPTGGSFNAPEKLDQRNEDCTESFFVIVTIHIPPREQSLCPKQFHALAAELRSTKTPPFLGVGAKLMAIAVHLTGYFSRTRSRSGSSLGRRDAAGCWSDAQDTHHLTEDGLRAW